MSDEQTRREQLAENMRFYADMRFKQLTLFMGGQTVLAAGVAQYPDVTLSSSIKLRAALALAGIFFTAVMWVMEVRATVNFFVTRDQAKDLWPMAKGNRWISSTNAVFCLHVAAYTFWLWCAQEWLYHRCLSLIVGSVCFVSLIVFSVLAYKPYAGPVQV